ncbi:glycosyltransferase family 9 protein [Enterobacteriaceae bacterium ML5]|nr:glycosyltransferase family 9 protein [Enterobacteriaceae bacterium ML5]
MKIWKMNLTNWALKILSVIMKVKVQKGTLPDPYRQFKSVIVYSTTALGDFMFNTPTMRALRNRYPDAKITLIAGTVNFSMVKKCKIFDDVIIWDCKFKNIIKALLKIKKARPELAVILHSHEPYDIITAVLSGSEFILTYNSRLPKGINSWVIYKPEVKKHAIKKRLDLMTFLGGDCTNVEMEIPCCFNKINVDHTRTRIGFNMGASNKNRYWPLGNYISLANKLISGHEDIDIILIGSSSDKELESVFLSNMPPSVINQRVISHIGRTDLPELISVIDSLDILLTGDTGPLHLAIALKVPTVSMFVTANPKYTGPYQDPEKHIIINYYENYINDCYDPLSPLSIITVETVYNAISEIGLLCPNG